MKRFLVFCALLAAGCADNPQDLLPSCEDFSLPATDACSFDGECQGYGVCIDGFCQLPETMTGEGAAGVIVVNDTTFSYELAASDFARARGLSGRPCMAPRWGLLLEWPDAAPRQITVELMEFDLDLLFIDAAGEPIDALYRVTAGAKALYGTEGDAQRVLEVEAGTLPAEVVSVRLE